MTPFSLSGLLAGIISLMFSLLVLAKSSDRKLARTWALFSFFAAVWGFGGFWIGMTKTQEAGILAWKVTYSLGVIWIAPAFFHFIQTFLGEKTVRAIIVQYGVGFLFVLLLFTGLLFSTSEFLFGQFHYIRAGYFFPLYFLWWMGLVFFSHARLLIAMKTVSGQKRKQIAYFFFATAIGFSGGSFTYLPNFGIDIYPWSNFTVTLYPVIMTYAILKFNLMDIRIFVRRAGLLVGVYLLLLLGGAPLIYLLHKSITGFYGLTGWVWGIEVVLMAGILSIGPFLYAHFVRRSTYFHQHTLAELTHELKSPLSAIEGALDILTYQAQEGATAAQQKEYLDMIDRNSARLRKFVDDLLLVMKKGAGKDQLRLEPADIGMLCQRVVSDYEHAAKTKGNTLVFQMANGESAAPPVMVNIDPAKIEKVLSNLLSNANKFTKEGKITVTLRADTTHVTIEVADTGAGLSADDIPYVFDAFYQSEAGKKAKGTGIGLSLAKLWVEAHGGDIGVDSDGVGCGSRFWFTVLK